MQRETFAGVAGFGGALVAAFFTFLPSFAMVLLGADGSTRGVRSIYGDMMLFYVPALSDTAGIRLLGVTQGLVSVRSL